MTKGVIAKGKELKKKMMPLEMRKRIQGFSTSKVRSLEHLPSARALIISVDTGEEGEDSIFSSNRAKLYGWEGGAWKERGAGTFRFNVSTSESEDTADPPKKARFIMRAHQTYRILLNAPVFKQMLIGDPAKKGEKPTGKTLSIPVVMDDGKPMPYLIRVRPGPLFR